MRIVVALPLVAACASDHGITGLCGREQEGFDIEEVSVLQDAQAYIGMHDAVVLDLDPEMVPAGSVWRVRSVEILPMIGASFFDFYPDGQRVSVEVWDGTDPTATAPFKVTQTFDKGALVWEDVFLSNPASALEQNQKQAWWRFDFGEVIPTSGMTRTQYLVGVVWEDSFDPTLGYSNFELPCDRNWTDYDDGRGWVLNTGQTTGDECSWPMLKVNLEILTESADCDGTSYDIE
jgi:hypothetical protein